MNWFDAFGHFTLLKLKRSNGSRLQ